MKKFLLAIRVHCEALMAKIEKNQIPIIAHGSENGEGSSGPGLSFDTAQEVIMAFKSYKKGSSAHVKDSSKIVIPRSVFLSLLEKAFPNLFLLRFIEKNGDTKILYSSTFEIESEIPMPTEAGLHTARAKFFIFSCLIALAAFISFWVKDADFATTLIVALAIIFVCFFFLLFPYTPYVVRKKKEKNRKIRKSWNALDGNYFFQGSANGLVRSSADYYPDLNLRFSKSIDYSKTLGMMLKSRGNLDFLLFKDRPTKVTNVSKRTSDSWKYNIPEIVYQGVYIPVLEDEDVLIFDIDSLADVGDVFKDEDSLLILLEDLFKKESFKLFLRPTCSI
jgi:hypothetical protein